MKNHSFIYNYSNDVDAIKRIIRNNLKDRSKGVRTLMYNLPADEGKLLRAILVLIGGSFGKIEKEKIMNTAAAVELLHLATLVHDDIVDEANVRRGKETLHERYNAKSALFAGDYLFSQAYVLFSENCSKQSIIDVSKTIKVICKAEIDQYLNAHSFELGVKDYLRRVNGKCASLFSLSLSIGALESKADSSIVHRLKSIGYYTGMAFQLIDDLLDIDSVCEALGKPAGNDIKQGIYNLPIILELKKGNKELLELIKEGNINEATNLVRNSEGFEKSREISEIYTCKALSLVDDLPNTDEKGILKQIIEKMLIRSY